MIGDFDTYGPRGSGDFDFKLIGAIPMKYIKGNLIDSWEVDQSKITWRVKSGIYWAPTEAQSAWMDAREFTAEDLAADLLVTDQLPPRLQDTPAPGGQLTD